MIGKNRNLINGEIPDACKFIHWARQYPMIRGIKKGTNSISISILLLLNYVAVDKLYHTIEIEVLYILQ